MIVNITHSLLYFSRRLQIYIINVFHDLTLPSLLRVPTVLCYLKNNYE